MKQTQQQVACDSVLAYIRVCVATCKMLCLRGKLNDMSAVAYGARLEMFERFSIGKFMTVVLRELSPGVP